MPKLAYLASKFLSSPPSFVESERLFSIGGMTYTPRRSRLKPQHGEQIITLGFNLKTYNSIEQSLQALNINDKDPPQDSEEEDDPDDPPPPPVTSPAC